MTKSLVLAAFLLLPLHAYGQLLFEDGFESGSLSLWPWGQTTEGGIKGATQDVSRSGLWSASFVCEPCYRVEVNRPGVTQLPWYTEHWLGFSIYIVELPTKWGILHQHHATPANRDFASCSAGPNGFTIRVVDGDLAFESTTDPRLVNVTPPYGSASWGAQILHREPPRLNEWLDVVMHVRYAPDRTGIMRVWLNDHQVIDHRGVTTYLRDRCGRIRDPYTYIKIGLYTGGGLGEIYYDDVRLGDSRASYEMVVPGWTGVGGGK